ncbi:uncharacterized protein LOC133312424 [Gastrolobium bilobum]|uniref:uncharacterized protein LOC133312424 n=1 Tax=Gastrolobium bilobum TaxID=150636 RepID=UPI002AAFA810|nr:uncharacterized protein LOC133312424 [Gastrolobium bilobum]
MDEDRIMEMERYQIQQIHQLDLEELEVEEVDHLQHSDSDSDSDSSHDHLNPTGDYADTSGEFTFNPSITSLHSYLGDVEDTRHRTAFLDGGAILNLPLFCLPGFVLFPGATLPLRVIVPKFVAAVERALSQVDVPYTIGVVRIHRDTANRRMKTENIGTTAEIRQYGRLEDGSLNVVTRGQQRFRLRRCWTDVEGVPYGEIQIIEEDLPLRTPRDAFGKSAPLSNMPSNHAVSHKLSSKCSRVKMHGSKNGENDSETTSDESFVSELSLMEKRIHLSVIGSSNVHDMMDESANSSDVEFMHKSDQEIISNLDETKNMDSRIGNCSTSGKQSSKEDDLDKFGKIIYACPSHKISRAFWPHWVYRMFDSYWLAQRAADMWRQIIGVPSMDGLIKKPDVLSFHIASKIPVSESTRQQLLDIDGIAYRLRREIELLESIDLIRCKSCQTIIAKRSDMLMMSSEGPLGAYVNPGGFVHEIMTFYKANGLALIGPASTEYSWFPGYAWTIAECATCKNQMGWLFTAMKRKLKPCSFWAIRSCRVAEEIRGNL